MAVTNWSTTPNSNTSISGINIAEGCPPSGINNAIRQMMADLKTEQNRVNSKISSDIASATSSLNTTIANNKVPIGTICMWSGTTSNIPARWALCNGANGTRDLRNRFIVGAGGNYSVGNTGGSDSITPSGSINVTISNHTLSTSQIPSHNHRVSGAGGQEGTWYGGSHDAWLTQTNWDTWASHNKYSSNTGGGGGHSHNIGTKTFSGNSFNNRPPYYALCFIQKVS